MAPREQLVPRVHLVASERLGLQAALVPKEQKVHLVQELLGLPVPRVRLTVLVPWVPLAQELLEYSEGWAHSVPRERRGLALVPMRPGRGWCLGRRKWGRRQAGLHWCPRTFGGAPGWRGRPWDWAPAGCRTRRGKWNCAA